MGMLYFIGGKNIFQRMTVNYITIANKLVSPIPQELRSYYTLLEL